MKAFRIEKHTGDGRHGQAIDFATVQAVDAVTALRSVMQEIAYWHVESRNADNATALDLRTVPAGAYNAYIAELAYS
ncbi:hypothetical protein LCGC14_1395890 [marine sediment metagenome]|uniref:Uncharacterized protein n=1 Tax=marine sediment metagenome TaxID=412755 RepID=A0A0F9KJH7_9ZZZZ